MRKHARSLVRVISEQVGIRELVGAEVGVWKGELSADLLRSFPKLTLHMYDLWTPVESSSMHDKDNSEEAMCSAMNAAWENTQFAGDRRILHKIASVDGTKGWSVCSADFVFVDADHFYESVKADVAAWWPIVKFGGILAGHDYNGQGDRRKGWGVKRAVDEYFDCFGREVNAEPGLVWWVKKT